MAPKQSVVRVRLEEDLTIYHAMAIKDQLLAALDKAEIIELDLSGVAAVDTAGVAVAALDHRGQHGPRGVDVGHEIHVPDLLPIGVRRVDAAADGDAGVGAKQVDRAESLGDVVVFHAGTFLRDGELTTAGGRVLGVTAVGENFQRARERAYDAVSRIRFEGMHYRMDIGLRGLKSLETS